VPSRKRPKSKSVVTPHDPIQRFAAALQESDARDQADRARARRQREIADAEARASAESAEELGNARNDLERAIERARSARRSGSGVPAADEAWRIAKARVIELETGAPPEWAHGADEDVTGDNPGEDPGDMPPVDAT
jgi:hypothetical protein